jgi:hypothetical protein
MDELGGGGARSCDLFGVAKGRFNCHYDRILFDTQKISALQFR